MASAKMIVRWVAAALVDAEKKFRRIRGYRDLADLFASLDEHVGKVQDQVQAA